LAIRQIPQKGTSPEGPTSNETHRRLAKFGAALGLFQERRAQATLAAGLGYTIIDVSPPLGGYCLSGDQALANL
jgi:hypothetical protein